MTQRVVRVSVGPLRSQPAGANKRSDRRRRPAAQSAVMSTYSALRRRDPGGKRNHMNGPDAGWNPQQQPQGNGPRNWPPPTQQGQHQQPPAGPPFPGPPPAAGYAQPGPQQPWPQQQPWLPPAPAPKKRGPWPWIIGAIALITVIALAVTAGVQWGRSHDSSSATATPSPTVASDVASANDHAPVGIITEDPSCGPWGPINDTLAETTKANRWESRDETIPASQWTPDMRTIFQSSADAFRKAADQTVPLIKLTPHRVMRELYEQYVAYVRAWANRVPAYTPSDFDLIRTGATIGNTLNGICQAITFRSALTRGPMVPAGPTPTAFAPIGDANNPTRFLSAPDPGCADWNRITDDIAHHPDLVAWLKEDSNLPASSWSPQYQAENEAAKPVLARIADTAEKLGHQASNPVIDDFGALIAQYERAMAAGIPTYTQPDIYLFQTFQHGLGVLSAACNSVGVK